MNTNIQIHFAIYTNFFACQETEGASTVINTDVNHVQICCLD